MKASRLAFAAILALLVGSVIMESRNTRRRLIRPSRRPVTTTVNVDPVRDTITDLRTIDSLMTLSDFQKTVSSRYESLLVANRSVSDTIFAVILDLNYTTEDGHQLHRRTVTLTTPVPPGETRHVAFPSWDRQQLFYYQATPPARPTGRTRPFRVTLTPVSLILSPAMEPLET